MCYNNDILLKASALEKIYRIYEAPYKRLLQTLFMGRKTFFRTFTALSNVNIELKRGECIGIIGKNGAGKSTLLEMLCGTSVPTSGKIYRRGKICALLELGFGFNTDFTGRENIELAGLMHGLTRQEIKTKTDSIIAFADIGEFIDQPVKTYSSGMFVRLAFSIIAHVDADIMLIDEALAVGDIFFQQKCYKFLEDKKKKCAMLLVSHDLNAIATLCDSVMVLDQSQIVFSGSSRDAIEYYTQLLYKHPEDDIECSVDIPENWQVIADKHKTGEYGQFIASSLSQGSVSADEVLHISARVKLSQECSMPIIGFFFKDRFGKRIFGNCVALKQLLSAGEVEFSFDIDWPDITPGEYTLTLGIGSGNDVMNQTVFCWATDFCVVTSINNNAIVHGIFNVPMNNFSYKGVY